MPDTKKRSSSSRVAGLVAASIDDLSPDPANARLHPEPNARATDASLKRFGAARSIVVDGKNVVRAGNRTLESARAAGIRDVLIVEPRPDQLVVVRRPDWSPSEATAYAIADNRSAELADWDEVALAQQLRALQSEDFELEAIGYEDREIDRLVARMGRNLAGEDGEGAAAPPDRAEELLAKWKVEVGQLWEVPSQSVPGQSHRVLCGDSTESDVVNRVIGADPIRLVWTDPPYGVSYASKNEFLNAVAPGNRIQTPIENDHLSEDETGRIAREALSLACAHAMPGASCYVACPPGTLLPFILAAFAASGFGFRWQLVWVKNHFVLGRSDYHFRHENILYGWKEGAHYFVDDHTKDSVFEFDKPHNSDLHPTTKPTGLVAECVANSSRPGEVVYDCFLGSGTTMVACEQIGRISLGCELTPGYTAVCLERLEGLGLEPRPCS